MFSRAAELISYLNTKDSIGRACRWLNVTGYFNCKKKENHVKLCLFLTFGLTLSEKASLKFTFVYCDTGFFYQEFHNCLECCLEKKPLIFLYNSINMSPNKKGLFVSWLCVCSSRWEEICKHFASSWEKKFFKKPFIFKITNSLFCYHMLYYHWWMDVIVVKQ